VRKKNAKKMLLEKPGVMGGAFGNLAVFRYLKTTPTNTNCFREEIKSTLNSGNACTM
jgi:hypothetical protein